MSYNIVLSLLLSMMSTMSSQLIQCSDDPGGLCTLECGEPSLCSDVTINCRANDACSITCAANQACSNLTINANDATDVTIICSATNACTNSIHVSCGTGDCVLQCDGTDSCSDLAYSSTVNHMSQTTSGVNLTTPTAILLLSVIACCAVMFVSTGFNCIYYKNMKRREQLFIQQNNNKIYCTAPVSPSVATAASVPSIAAVSSLSPVSQQLSVSPFETSSADEVSRQSAQSRLSMDETMIIEPGQATHLSVPLKLAVVHASTYSQLPLDMTKPAFEVRVSNDTNDRQSDVEISVSRTDSFRL